MQSFKVKLDHIIIYMMMCYPLLYSLKSLINDDGAIGLHHFYDFILIGLIFIQQLKRENKKLKFFLLPLFLFLLLSVITFIIKGNISSGFFGYYHRWIVFLFSILFGISVARKSEITTHEFYKFLDLFVYLCIFFGVLQLIIGDTPFLNGKYRLSGQYRVRPVVYSLNLFICLIIYTIRTHKYGKKERIRNLITLFVIVTLIYLTYSRLTLLISLTFIFMVLKIHWRYKVGLAVLFTGLIVFLIAQTTVLYRFETLFLQLQDTSEYRGDGSLLLRIRITTFMLGKLAENWLLGLGPGMFNQVWEASFGESGMSPHFGILTIIVENGVLGSMLLLTFVVLLLIYVYRFRNKDIYTAKVFILSFLLYYLGSTFNTPLYKTELVFIFNTFLFFVAFREIINKADVKFLLVKREVP